MNRLFIGIALWMLHCVVFAAGCTFANSGTTNDSLVTLDPTVGYTSAAFTNAVNAGDLVVIGYSNFNTNPANLGVPTDSQGNTFTKAVSIFDSSGSHGTIFFTAKAGSTSGAGSYTYTVVKSGQASGVLSAYWTIAAANWDGTTVLDGAGVTNPATNNTAGPTGTTITVAMNSLTSSRTDCLMQLFGSREQASVTAGTPQTGWTASVSLNNATQFTQLASASRSISGTSSGPTAGWPSVTNAAGRNLNMVAIAIKGAGPAGSAAPQISVITLGM